MAAHTKRMHTGLELLQQIRSENRKVTPLESEIISINRAQIKFDMPLLYTVKHVYSDHAYYEMIKLQTQSCGHTQYPKILHAVKVALIVPQDNFP